MRGAVLLGDRQIELREFPDPIPGPGQVVVRIKASGICGSELHGQYRPTREQREQARGWLKISGHEPCGEVEAVGEGVTLVKPGDRTIVYHPQGCGVCDTCMQGWMIHCPHKLGGYGNYYDGGHADYLLVNNQLNCRPLADELSYADGACMACGTGTAFQALRRLNVSGRDQFAAFGLGPVGLSAVLLAKAMGARVIGADLIPERLDLAKQLGADEVIDVTKCDAVEAVKDWAGSDGPSVAADFSGNPKARNQALDSVASFGRVGFVGERNITSIDISPQVIHKQLTIVGSWVYSFQALAELNKFLVMHDLHADRMVTHRFPLDRIGEAMELFDTGRTGKVIIEFP